MYALIGSAKLNGIDPEAYLSHVLVRIADHPIIRSLESKNFCPGTWTFLAELRSTEGPQQVVSTTQSCGHYPRLQLKHCVGQDGVNDVNDTLTSSHA
jgi:hypothetical protein